MGGYDGWQDYIPQQAPKPKRSKYRAEPTEVDGHRFASKKEANRYQALKLEQQAGAISSLELQPQFPLHAVTPAGVVICIGRYVADFRYIRDQQVVIEDTKGFRTELFKWKLNHVNAEYGIRVVET